MCWAQIAMVMLLSSLSLIWSWSFSSPPLRLIICLFIVLLSSWLISPSTHYDHLWTEGLKRMLISPHGYLLRSRSLSRISEIQHYFANLQPPLEKFHILFKNFHISRILIISQKCSPSVFRKPKIFIRTRKVILLSGFLNSMPCQDVMLFTSFSSPSQFVIIPRVLEWPLRNLKIARRKLAFAGLECLNVKTDKSEKCPNPVPEQRIKKRDYTWIIDTFS